MAAKQYLVQSGLKRAIIVADTEDDAKATAKAAISDDTNTDWDTASVTELTATAGTSYEGWRFNVKVDTPLDVELYNVTVTGDVADTIDEVGADLVVELEAAGGELLTPSYDAGLNVLTIAAIGDAIGDHKVYVYVRPPVSWEDPDIVIPGLAGVVTDEGIAAAVLEVDFDGVSIPVINSAFYAPEAEDVEAGVEYGDAGSETTGTFAVPAEADVEAGVEFGDSAEFTGTLAVDNNAFSVIVPDSTVMPVFDKVNSVVVAASSSADALAMAKALSGVDADSRWDTATVAETAEATDMEDWTLTAIVTTPAGAELYNVSVTGASTDVLADLAADLVTALETEGGASLTPSYDSATGILTVAAIADDIGDHTLSVEVHSPLSTSVAIPGFVTTIVDEGIAGAVLTAQLINDNLIPAIVLRSDRRE